MHSYRPRWLKRKGYLHITPQLDIEASYKKTISKVTDPDFVAGYAFLPLIHSSIKERRYKKVSNQNGNKKRAHSYKDKSGRTVKNEKVRPLHYAAHFDALIFGYYSELLLNQYERVIENINGLSDCVLAYRRIPIKGTGKNKSTIHFAKEVFDEIVKRTNDDCVVLKYDITSFFNRMDHKVLLKAWMDIFNFEDKLPKHHFNVYNAVTRFSYIMLDDLRLASRRRSKKAGFDEMKLALIRKNLGTRSFFFSLQEFRETIESGHLRVYKFPFRDKKTGFPVGIPQGLPISSVLANLYLLQFDLDVLNKIVEGKGGFYRRYSDDLIIICKKSELEEVHDFVLSKIKESKVEINPSKAEMFLFRKVRKDNNTSEVRSYKLENGRELERIPLTYLGFEFYGYKTLIKSSNIAKFYRRMIYTIKRKARRAFAQSAKNPDITPAIYFNQLNKLYKNQNLNKVKLYQYRSKLVPNDVGEYYFVQDKQPRRYNSNYLSYIQRVNNIMGDNLIKRQLRNHKKIFSQALQKHFFSKLKAY